MINAIRSTDNNNMIVMDDSSWGQGATYGASSALTSFANQLAATSDNILGSVHAYQGGNEQTDETCLQSASR